MSGKKKISPSSNTYFDIHTLPIRCKSSVPEATEALRSRLYSYISSSTQPAQINLEIVSAIPSTLEEIRKIPKQFHWERNRPFWGAYKNELLSVTDGTSLCHIDYSRLHAKYFISPETIVDPHFFSRTFLLLPIIELLRTRGFIFMHAACVTKENQVILIVGKGGEGKSTLAAALLQKGYSILSDDNLLLHLDRTVCYTYPFERELSLSQEAFSQLSVSSKKPSEERNKLRMRLDEWGKPAFRVKPTILILLGAESPSSTDLLEHLIAENPMIWVGSALASRHLQTLQTLIKQVKVVPFSSSKSTPLNLKDLGQDALRAVSSLHAEQH